MKIKYISFVALLVLGMQPLSSCKEDFLEVKPKGRNLESNYYLNAGEAYNGLIAAYDPVGWVAGSLFEKVSALSAASDDHYAGGGSATDINQLQVWSNYKLDPSTGPQEDMWRRGYQGIFRANVLLQKLPGVPMDENMRNRFTAEAKFLRAYYYFDLVRLFRRIPLFTAPVSGGDAYSATQVDRTEVYKQIEEDLIAAIPNLPTTITISTEAGRASQGAGRALLGKVYLQQEKFALAAAELEQVNGAPGSTSPYGYKLLSNFGDLFQTNNKFNTESIFEVAHTSTSNAGWGCIGCTEGNILNQLVGPRGYSIKMSNAGAPTYISGYSFLPITQNLVDAYKLPGGKYDPRYKYTVSNIDSLAKAGVVAYEPGFMNTGYFVAKYAGKVADESTGGGDKPLNWKQNTYEIRLADTYLMEAEALVRSGVNTTRAQSLLDAVRARVGLSTTPATFDNILLERRLELAVEGHRWFDLVRTGKAATALAFKGFVPGKHEALPVPLLELNNTQLEQDPAYQ